MDWIKNNDMFDVLRAGYQTLTIPQDGSYRLGETFKKNVFSYLTGCFVFIFKNLKSLSL